MKMLTTLALKGKQFFSIFMAFFVMIGGLVGNLFGGMTADTEENYRAKIAQNSLYENTIETAIPQTAIADLVSKHFSSELLYGKTEKKAIIIGYDGCRADAIEDDYNSGAIHNLMADGAYAYIGYCGGANYPEKQIQDTSTAPGWCSILTGTWADTHGVTGNGIPKSNENLTLLTSLVENKTIDSSAFYTMWSGHFIDENSTYINEKKYCEENKLNVKFKKDLFDKPTYLNTLDDVKNADCSDFIFSILEGPDFYGHATGFSPYNPVYNLGLQTDENYANTIIETIKNRESYDSEDWLIVLASDHGGVNNGHGGDSIQERMTFIVTNKEIDNELSGEKPEKTYYDKYVLDILMSEKYTMAGSMTGDGSNIIFSRYQDGTKSAVIATITTNGIISFTMKLINDDGKATILIPAIKRYFYSNDLESSDFEDIDIAYNFMDSSQMNYLGLATGSSGIVREVYESIVGKAKIKFCFRNDTLTGIEIINEDGTKFCYNISIKAGVDDENVFSIPSDYTEITEQELEEYIGGLNND